MSIRFGQHKTNHYYIVCISQWMELVMNLRENHTINKFLQECENHYHYLSHKI